MILMNQIEYVKNVGKYCNGFDSDSIIMRYAIIDQRDCGTKNILHEMSLVEPRKIINSIMEVSIEDF